MRDFIIANLYDVCLDEVEGKTHIRDISQKYKENEECIVADNDKQFVKTMKKTIKSIKFSIDYFGEKVADEESGNNLILKHIESGDPFCAVRYGAVEARCLDKWMRGEKYSEYNKTSIKEAAGFFPNEDTMIDLFCEIYSNAARDADILAVWGVKGEKNFVKKFSNKAKLIRILSLEPYFFEHPWSSAMRDKKVLIIHPFSDTIREQLTIKNKLFVDENVLPDFKAVYFIKAVQSNAGEVTSYTTWFDALDFMKSEISKVDFDIAIIGAGAYGLALAAYCKQLNKQAIQMAGATQLLFGVKGKRWEERPEYQRLFNEYWVRPSILETPSGKNKVEGGSYW